MEVGLWLRRSFGKQPTDAGVGKPASCSRLPGPSEQWCIVSDGILVLAYPGGMRRHGLVIIRSKVPNLAGFRQGKATASMPPRQRLLRGLDRRFLVVVFFM